MFAVTRLKATTPPTAEAGWTLRVAAVDSPAAAVATVAAVQTLQIVTENSPTATQTLQMAVVDTLIITVTPTRARPARVGQRGRQVDRLDNNCYTKDGGVGGGRSGRPDSNCDINNANADTPRERNTQSDHNYVTGGGVDAPGSRSSQLDGNHATTSSGCRRSGRLE